MIDHDSCVPISSVATITMSGIPMSGGPSSLKWVEILEGEFDRLYREIHHEMASLSDTLEESQETQGVMAEAQTRMNAVASVFAQLVHKSRAVFQSNCKLEVGVSKELK